MKTLILILLLAVNSIANVKNNPDRISDCSKPQQRYRKSQDYYRPQFIGYKTCLPSCIIQNKTEITKEITHTSGGIKTMIKLTNHIACSYTSISTDTSNKNSRPGK